MTQDYFNRRTDVVLLILCFIFTLLFQIPFFISPVGALGSTTALVIQSQQITAYNEAIQGFKEGCRGKNISIEAVYDLKGNTEEGGRIIQIIKDREVKPDLILAVGILAATLVKEQFNDIPIIFCMVINYERFNLQGNNITGISSEASLEDQFTVLREFLGDHKRVGVIYDPMKTGKIVSEAIKVVKQFELNLVKSEVQSEREVAPVFNKLSTRIDALWIIPDGTVITRDSLEVILKGSLKKCLPTFCTSSAIVKAGALASISTDYRYTGFQASEIAQTLLNNPEVSSLGVKSPDKLKVTLNTQTAKMLEITIPPLHAYPNVILYP